MQDSITGRGAALAAGVLALAGALAILLQDALMGSRPWQLEHGLIPVLMGVQVLSAHLIVAAWRSGKLGSALGFGLVAGLATFAVLYTSTAKQSALAAQAQAITRHVADERLALERKLALNSEMLDGARTAFAAECASGRGKRCEGQQATIDVYADAVRGVEAQLAGLPVLAHTTRADAMAELVSVVAGLDQARVRHGLLLSEPFMYATVFELAALMAFGFAFAPKGRDKAATQQAITETDEGVLTDPEIDELRQLLRSKRSLSNDGVAAALRVSKSEASKRVTAAVQQGLVSRERAGRHVAIRLN